MKTLKLKTELNLEGTENQLSYAQNLIDNTFGQDLMKLERLRSTCEKMAKMPTFPKHAHLAKMEAEWEQVKNSTKAGDVIEILKPY